jgi:hypothetical protein
MHTPPKRLSLWRWLALLALVLIIVVAIAPIPRQVLLVSGNWQGSATWPRIQLLPQVPQPGQRVEVVISDVVPWTNVQLIAGDVPVTYERYEQNALSGYWSWYWSFVLPASGGVPLAFYHNCDIGCIEWATATIGTPQAQTQPATIPTKLGLVFADPNRNWHNRAGWSIELTYALKADEDYWGIDDLAQRVQRAHAKGLRVLVRVDFDQQQTLPPADEFLAFDLYLDYIRRLARDQRLADVYGYIIGNGYNALNENALAPDRLITPQWYARLFNGYGADPTHTDNVIETIRSENSTVRVLVGSVRPWTDDQDGAQPSAINAPWLNYMNTTLAMLEESAYDNEEIGIPLTAPDGFAISAHGYPDAPALLPAQPADEPRAALPLSDWNGAQAGFRIYTDWLGVINSYARFRGLPVYVTTNTSTTSDVPPAQNYPRGWLTNALAVVNAEPQIAALIWFLDSFPMDKQWELYSLTNPQGLLIDAAEEFDSLLAARP